MVQYELNEFDTIIVYYFLLFMHLSERHEFIELENKFGVTCLSCYCTICPIVHSRLIHLVHLDVE